MKRIPDNLRIVVKHFPQHKKAMETLFHQNDSFRSLCEDFRDCVQAIEYWSGLPPNKDQAHAFSEEYKSLYADLKGEIARTLEDLEEDVQLD